MITKDCRKRSRREWWSFRCSFWPDYPYSWAHSRIRWYTISTKSLERCSKGGWKVWWVNIGLWQPFCFRYWGAPWRLCFRFAPEGECWSIWRCWRSQPQRSSWQRCPAVLRKRCIWSILFGGFPFPSGSTGWRCFSGDWYRSSGPLPCSIPLSIWSTKGTKRSFSCSTVWPMEWRWAWHLRRTCSVCICFMSCWRWWRCRWSCTRWCERPSLRCASICTCRWVGPRLLWLPSSFWWSMGTPWNLPWAGCWIRQWSAGRPIGFYLSICWHSSDSAWRLPSSPWAPGFPRPVWRLPLSQRCFMRWQWWRRGCLPSCVWPITALGRNSWKEPGCSPLSWDLPCSRSCTGAAGRWRSSTSSGGWRILRWAICPTSSWALRWWLRQAWWEPWRIWCATHLWRSVPSSAQAPSCTRRIKNIFTNWTGSDGKCRWYSAALPYRPWGWWGFPDWRALSANGIWRRRRWKVKM